MANLASVFKEEIVRLTRKTVKAEIEPIKKTTNYRAEIATLKRRVAELEKMVARLAKAASHPTSSGVAFVDEDLQAKFRFRAAGLKKLRERFELSAATLGSILNVSTQTIYNWESGLTKPNSAQVEKIAILKKMSKREVQARLRVHQQAS